MRSIVSIRGPIGRELVIIVSLVGLLPVFAKGAETQASGKADDFDAVLSVMQAAHPEQYALARLALGLPLPQPSWSAKQSHELDAMYEAAEKKMQQLVVAGQKNPASAPELIKKAQQIDSAVERDLDKLLTKQQQQELNSRGFVTNGEVLAFMNDPARVGHELMETLKPTADQKKKLQPVLDKGAARISQLAQELETVTGTKGLVLGTGQLMTAIETLAKVHKLLTPEQGMLLVTMVMQNGGAPASQPASNPSEVGTEGKE